MFSVNIWKHLFGNVSSGNKNFYSAAVLRSWKIDKAVD